MEFRNNKNIDKTLLSNGMVIDNWKSLCELMNWKYTHNGKSVIAQKKTLGTVCKWHKEKRSIIIDKVYNKELTRKEISQKKITVIEIHDDIHLDVLFNYLDEQDVNYKHTEKYCFSK